MRENDWLIDRDFLSEQEYENKYHLETVGRSVHNFLKNTPVPFIVKKGLRNGKLDFYIGSIDKKFVLDANVSTFDFITRIKSWASSFYPSYDVNLTKEVAFTEDEILEKMENAEAGTFDINDLLLETRQVEYNEKGVIIKVIFKRDEFILQRNNVKEIRMTGTKNNFMTLSQFKKELRGIQLNGVDIDIYKFIENNSRLVKELEQDTKEILITYQGQMMLNFFKINFNDLKDYDLVKKKDHTYLWRNFLIKFENSLLEDDCVAIYNNLKEK